MNRCVNVFEGVTKAVRKIKKKQNKRKTTHTGNISNFVATFVSLCPMEAKKKTKKYDKIFALLQDTHVFVPTEFS